MTPLERHRFRLENHLDVCVACGGSGRSSKGDLCFPCSGTGAEVGVAHVAQHLSESVEHYTPVEIVEAARTVLGGIDLDPASCPMAQEVVRAEAWYGPGSPFGEDGLAEPWLGRVFLNPPGGIVSDEYAGCGTRSNAALWWATLAEAWRTGEVESAIFIGFTLEILRSTQALEVSQPLDFPLCVPSSRIKFDTIKNGERKGSSSPTHANVIVYLPPHGDRPSMSDINRFVEVFGEIGRCRI